MLEREGVVDTAENGPAKVFKAIKYRKREQRNAASCLPRLGQRTQCPQVAVMHHKKELIKPF